MPISTEQLRYLAHHWINCKMFDSSEKYVTEKSVRNQCFLCWNIFYAPLSSPPIPLSNSTDIRLKRGSLRGSLILHMMQYTIYQLLNNTPKNKYCIINYLMFSICVGRVAIKGRGHKRSNWSYFPILVYFIKQHNHWLLINLIISYLIKVNCSKISHPIFSTKNYGQSVNIVRILDEFAI